MLFESSSNSKVWIFMLQEITNLILISKNLLIVMVPLLINKDAFEPSDDLKFMDQNNNNFFTSRNNVFGLCESTGSLSMCETQSSNSSLGSPVVETFRSVKAKVKDL